MPTCHRLLRCKLFWPSLHLPSYLASDKHTLSQKIRLNRKPVRKEWSIILCKMLRYWLSSGISCVFNGPNLSVLFTWKVFTLLTCTEWGKKIKLASVTGLTPSKRAFSRKERKNTGKRLIFKVSHGNHKFLYSVLKCFLPRQKHRYVLLSCVKKANMWMVAFLAITI